MRSLSFLAFSLLLAQAPFSYAEKTVTVAVTVVQNPTSTYTISEQTTASSSDLAPAASSSETTFATSKRTSSTESSTSVLQATHVQPNHAASASSGGYSEYDGSDADGASGTDSGSFSLSNGGLIAIIVVVVVVAVFGIASIVLYVVAKRRQWNIRQSIRRASRRLTGRHDNTSRRNETDRRKRSGVIAGSKSGVTAARPPGHKRGLVVDVKDQEKGPLDYGTPPKTKKPRENTWIQRLWGNDWK